MLNWKKISDTFIHYVNDRSEHTTAGRLLPYSINLLRHAAGAYTSLQVVFEDKVTAKVKDATPAFLDELVLNPGPLEELLAEHRYEPFGWEEIPVKKNPLQDVLTALSAAAIIPLNINDRASMLVLGWSEPQVFDASFTEAAVLIRKTLESALTHTSRTDALELSNTYFTAILEAMPQAVIFIDDNGRSGWLNKQAARLLKLPMSGEMAPGAFAGAMADWRNSAANVDDINAKAAQFFSSPGNVIKDWIWQFGGDTPAQYSVSCTPVKHDQFTGKLWVFHKMVVATI
ncbi:PAS domain-containing protein [Filimonas zeae]|uniref:PAS domain-containing protein n=1 Tax=Filimonas zeae TaxID=1737353 RepID=A0A917IKU4_9BACT|nr:PAS domain-containing protein [Filimonas zeae]MDR6337031.1 PAS domain-containing protein [Filimonas zeae]GGH56668.1 hypothetical protein GCM10011379_00520 [Filimonas zeae]